MIMTFDNFRKYVDKIPTDVKLHFSGMAEPFLNPECSTMIEYAYNKRHLIGIYTSLIGMSKKDIKRLKGKYIDPFVIHTPDNNFFRLRNDGIDEWIRTLKLLLKFRLNFEVLIVGKTSIDSRIVRVISNSKRKVVSTPICSRASNLDTVKVEYRKGKIKCKQGRLTKNVLLPNGNILLCCMDYGQRHVLGNLNEGNYHDIFNSEAYTRVLDSMNDETIESICRYCENAIEA